MKIKTFAIILALALAATLSAQRRINFRTPPVSASAQASPQPRPTPDMPTDQPNLDEVSEAQREELQPKVMRAETTVGLADMGVGVGEEARKAPGQAAEVYEKAPRDSQLAYPQMTRAFDDAGKQIQASTRLLLLQLPRTRC